jgi:hypothetical protein
MDRQVAIQITNETVPMITATLFVDDRNDFRDVIAELKLSESAYYFVTDAQISPEPLNTETQIMPEHVFNEIYFVPPSAPDNAWFSVTRF